MHPDSRKKLIERDTGFAYLKHKGRHDPEDGSDPLDTAIAVDTSTANAIGTSHSLSRSDHVHALHDHDHSGDTGDGGQDIMLIVIMSGV